MKYIFEYLGNGYYYEHFPKAYSFDVVTCEEASIARHVELQTELKHILVSASDDIYMIHIPGNKLISFNKVKKIIKSKNIEFANLEDYGLVKGAVCPFIISNWNFKHLFDISIFENKWMTTNDGTLNGYFKFDVNILKETKQYIIKDLLKDENGH